MTSIEKLRHILEQKERLYWSTSNYYAEHGPEEKHRQYTALWSEVSGMLMMLDSEEHLNDIYNIWCDAE